MNRQTQRISMQVTASPSGCRKVIGAAVTIVSLALGYATWGQPPEPPPSRVAVPEAIWTPTSAAPAGLLTRLEGEHHDRFIDRARAGDIDIVFFGTTSTEMWSWPDRGRSVWDRVFGSLKAASFGSQGTTFASLLWRTRNGELDGYRAKLVVLQGFGPASGDQAIAGNGVAELVAGYAAIITEIRARQPQAKILLVASFPRGQLRLEPWREIAAENAAAYAELEDDETVFYSDIGERFFLPDGSFNGALWASPGTANVGMQTPAFEVWAEELPPWIERFVR